MDKTKIPSLTIAIPARNETKELTHTLKKLLTLDYEKLEILVLDDCSQDKTSQTIKDFAHKGVRFIAGKTPPEPWLGKNYAIKQLADQASGKYILFTDADLAITDYDIKLLQDSLKSNESVSALALDGTNTYLNFMSQAIFQPWPLLSGLKTFRKSNKVSFWLVSTKEVNLHIDKNYDNPNMFSSPLFEATLHEELNGIENFNRTTTRQSLAENFLPNQYFSVRKNHDYFVRVLYHTLNRSTSKMIFMALAMTVIPIVQISLFFINPWFAMYFYIGTLWVVGHIFMDVLLSSNDPFGLFNDGIKPISKRISMLIIRIIFLIPTLAYCGWLITESLVKYRTNRVEWRGRNICYPLEDSNFKKNR